MIFGFNTEVRLGNTVYHVQTEDHGAQKHTLETTVYLGGRLIHRRKVSYEELLASPNFSEAALRQRLEEQHREVLEELRSGSLTFEAPGAKPAAAPPAPPATLAKPAAQPVVARPAPPPAPAAVPLAEAPLHPATAVNWYAAGTTTMKIDIKSKSNNQPLTDAMLQVSILGPQGPISFAARTDSKGRVELVFPLPRMGPGGAEILIKPAGEDEIRYSLKPKAK